ncbi:MAG: diaminopimelate decarboxylase [Candidatus Rokuibacteriota bacterium]|nr:MAG: diaminopimelate decarboxylase [Candidatus Rokubacteria bacterium]
MSQAYPLGTAINERGHLEVGGCDVVELAERFGTPAYIYAEDDMRARARAYVEAFAARTDDFEVVYASKALPITAAYGLMAEEGLSVDVASGGELFLALRGGVPPARIFMHGNNKTERELELAFEAGIGYLVLDSLREIELAEQLLARAGRSQRVMIRVTPGIMPSTHSYIQTGQIDSKFGFGLEDGLAAEAVRRAQASERLDLVGIHAHIGSQIFELEPYAKTIRLLADFVRATAIECRMLNVGGGLGIAYTAEDEPASIEDYVDVKVRGIQQTFDPVPRILVEPGRSLVGNAGLTAYRVGTVKEIPGVRTYVSVDGGMSDNLRPMLYGARYDAAIASRPDASATHVTTIAGMHCESGDILIRDVALPDPRPGDVLVTPATGGYGYAMANNYNGVPRPPVIFCRDGTARVVVRRETYEDLAARDE